MHVDKIQKGRLYKSDRVYGPYAWFNDLNGKKPGGVIRQGDIVMVLDNRRHKMSFKETTHFDFIKVLSQNQIRYIHEDILIQFTRIT